LAIVMEYADMGDLFSYVQVSDAQNMRGI